MIIKRDKLYGVEYLEDDTIIEMYHRKRRESYQIDIPEKYRKQISMSYYQKVLDDVFEFRHSYMQYEYYCKYFIGEAQNPKNEYAKHHYLQYENMYSLRNKPDDMYKQLLGFLFSRHKQTLVNCKIDTDITCRRLWEDVKNNDGDGAFICQRKYGHHTCQIQLNLAGVENEMPDDILRLIVNQKKVFVNDEHFNYAEYSNELEALQNFDTNKKNKEIVKRNLDYSFKKLREDLENGKNARRKNSGSGIEIDF